MNIPAIATDIASRVPAMASDSPINNAWLIESLIRQHVTQTKRPESVMAAIIRTVADHYGLTVAEMLCRNRTARVSTPRQIALTLARELTDQSLPAIARTFMRDHGTVIHANRAIRNRCETDRHFARDVDYLKGLCVSHINEI